jgi:hypothetical protein
MKTVLSIIPTCLFSLNAITEYADCRQQKKNEKTTVEMSRDSVQIKADTISNYAISINGKLNSVQITTDKPLTGIQDTNSKATKSPNVIEVGGENNSINISQSNASTRVNIKQNGCNNQINISQSNRSSDK